jgi:hypothetical protein
MAAIATWPTAYISRMIVKFIASVTKKINIAVMRA